MRKKNNGELSGVKEIARRAQVSIATVDRVLHNRPGVSVKTKAKIEAIIKEIDYKPNLLARRLASRKVFKLQCSFQKSQMKPNIGEARLPVFRPLGLKSKSMG